MADEALSEVGVVWAFTWQRFPPASPPYMVPESGFEPFAVGYVEIDEQVKVLGVLEDVLGDVHGMSARLVATSPIPRFRVEGAVTHG